MSNKFLSVWVGLTVYQAVKHRLGGPRVHLEHGVGDGAEDLSALLAINELVPQKTKDEERSNHCYPTLRLVFDI